MELLKRKNKKPEEKVTDEYVLGKWDGGPLTVVPGSTPGSSYAEMSYIGGTRCDLTGAPRKATVRYRCNRNIPGTRVENFQEVESCVYVFNVALNSLCNHEKFQPAKVRTEEIVCYLTQGVPDISEDNSDLLDIVEEEGESTQSH